MCLRIDHKRRPSFLRIIFRYRLRACMCVFERSCARVYLPISRERNETFLVKVFIRFLVKVSNFSAASVILMYIYALFIIMYLAQFMYISVIPQSLGSEKKKGGAGGDPRSYHFSWRTRAHSAAARLRHRRENWSQICEVDCEISLRSYSRNYVL